MCEAGLKKIKTQKWDYGTFKHMGLFKIKDTLFFSKFKTAVSYLLIICNKLSAICLLHPPSCRRTMLLVIDACEANSQEKYFKELIKDSYKDRLLQFVRLCVCVFMCLCHLQSMLRRPGAVYDRFMCSRVIFVLTYAVHKKSGTT